MSELETIKKVAKRCAEDKFRLDQGDYSYEVFCEYLKIAAIKDIKEIYCFEQTDIDKLFDDFIGRKTIYSEEAKQGIINYIKWKFNITEEDLK